MTDPDVDDDVDDDDDDDEAEIDDESFPESIEGEPRTVLITGACGNIGRKLRAAWADIYDLVLIDRTAAEDDPDVIAADLTRSSMTIGSLTSTVSTRSSISRPTPDERARLGRPVEPNLDALANVFHAAALAGVERLIFASSNHVMGDCRIKGDEPISVDMKPMPDGPYASLNWSASGWAEAWPGPLT